MLTVKSSREPSVASEALSASAVLKIIFKRKMTMSRTKEMLKCKGFYQHLKPDGIISELKLIYAG